MIAALLWLWVLPASAQVQPSFDTEAQAVADMIYELRFDSAAAAAQDMAAAHPGHPAGPFFQGLVIYQHFSLEETPRPQEVADFQYRMAETADFARAWISTDAALGNYYYGAALGFDARWLASQGRYIKAMPEGLRSVKTLKKSLVLDPTLHDAYLALGLYHYFRSRLPPLAKPFAFLLSGEWGNRELGLRELRLASEKGALCRTEAVSAQANIYLSDEEKQWQKAETLLKKLVELHPRYPAFRLRLAYADEQLGRWDEAAAAADPHGNWLNALEPALREGVRTFALYRAAEALLLSGRADQAAGLVRELESRPLPDTLVDWVFLRRGNVFDAQGNEKAADRCYRTAEHGDSSRAASSSRKLRYPNGLKIVKPLTGIEAPS